MSLKSDLTAARALIDTPEKWRKDGEAEFTSCCAVIAVCRSTIFNREGACAALYRNLPEQFMKMRNGQPVYYARLPRHTFESLQRRPRHHPRRRFGAVRSGHCRSR
jgi:hypothetical protein